jgi:hypothetical protein
MVEGVLHRLLRRLVYELASSRKIASAQWSGLRLDEAYRPMCFEKMDGIFLTKVHVK